MAESDFIMAVGPDGVKRLVPPHYLDNPAFGFTLPPSARVKEPAAAQAKTTIKEPAAAGETKEVRS